jgi:hypothetical protein
VDVKVRTGDTLDVCRSGEFIAKVTVKSVEGFLGSPPPPDGMDRIGILIDGGWTQDRDDLEVWLVPYTGATR